MSMVHFISLMKLMLSACMQTPQQPANSSRLPTK